MAKSDLLKEAIADAKAVKETALANAKIALQEAFAPRIQSMLSAKLSEELMDEQDELEDAEMDMAAGEEMDVPAEPMDDMEADAGEPMDVGDIEIDTDMDGEIDFTGDIMSKPGAEMDMEDEVGEMDMEMDMEPEMDDEEDLGLEEIIAELEEGLDEGDYSKKMEEDEMMKEEAVEEQVKDEAGDDGDGMLPESADKSIDELIEAILAEEEVTEEINEEEVNEEEKEDKEKLNAAHCNEAVEALEEAYDTVNHLKSVINEVNLLNAKLLYTNKLFRNFDLNEGQKMKVIENFDRAANTREAKLVFSTLAESFHKPTTGKKKVVKESKSLASKAVATTAPSKETKQVLSEGFEQANRWKKLAGLI